MLFEYKCNQCNQITEVLEHYSKPSVKDCSICGGNKSTHRIISQTSFALDNSGWHKESYTKG